MRKESIELSSVDGDRDAALPVPDGLADGLIEDGGGSAVAPSGPVCAPAGVMRKKHPCPACDRIERGYNRAAPGIAHAERPICTRPQVSRGRKSRVEPTVAQHKRPRKKSRRGRAEDRGEEEAGGGQDGRGCPQLRWATWYCCRRNRGHG